MGDRSARRAGFRAMVWTPSSEDSQVRSLERDWVALAAALRHGPQHAGRVHPGAPVAQAPVQVGAGGAAGQADVGDHLAGGHPLAHPQQHVAAAVEAVAGLATEVTLLWTVKPWVPLV